MAQMLLLSLCVGAQSVEGGASAPKRKSESALTFGVGGGNVLDTYLSPYDYKGVDLRLMHEYLKETKGMNGHMLYQSFFDLDFGLLKNHTKNVEEYAGNFRYSSAWLYRLWDASTTHPYDAPGGCWGAVGVQPSVFLGGVYNSRNGNNPAQLKTDFMVNATAMVQYNISLFHKVFPLRYQMTVPLLGIAYSPAYGQSYYENFMLKDYDHNVCFGHIANMPSMRHLLTLDIPVQSSFIRIGWNGEFNQAKLNGLKYHSYSNNFVVGVVF